MSESILTRVISIKNMVCSGCERIIKDALIRLPGIKRVEASYKNNQVKASFDPLLCTEETLSKAIAEEGYEVAGIRNENSATSVPPFSKIRPWLELGVIALIIVGLYLLIDRTIGFNFLPEVTSSMGLMFAFVIGLLTSFHCIGMCGGINLSQNLSWKKKIEEKGGKHTVVSNMMPGLLYNGGRVLSYTVIGGIIGGIGSVFNFNESIKSGIIFLAGLVMILMGLNMLNLFSVLKKIPLKMPGFIQAKIIAPFTGKGPFFVGILNGLMPCGPLQAMQIYALGTGSVLKGALAMFLFSVGTAPLMFGFGFFASMIQKKYAGLINRFSAVLVIVLGVILFSRGFNFLGISVTPVVSKDIGIAVVSGGTQSVATSLKPNSYDPIIVQKGIPVVWKLTAENGTINGCNRTFKIPEYGIEHTIRPGENVIEFTPMKAGTFGFSCWMGMISSQIKVVENIASISKEELGAISKENQSRKTANCCAADGQQGYPYSNQFKSVLKSSVFRDITGEETVTINVSEKGLSPALMAVMRGTKIQFVFNAPKTVQGLEILYFPLYRGALNLTNQEFSTPALDMVQDFEILNQNGEIEAVVAVTDAAPDSRKITEEWRKKVQ